MINEVLVNERLAMIAEFYKELQDLKSLSKKEFMETRNWAAAESFLRRSLEGIFDVGRHILSKSGGVELAKEYKGIAVGLGRKKVVTTDMSCKLVEMAGYRNRMVHLYHQIGEEELYDLVQNHLDDLALFIKEISAFLKGLPEK